MKLGDLIRVRYEPDDQWYHGFVMETPDGGPFAVWQMWCIERSAAHVLAPRKDEIEILSEAPLTFT
jgi:hypothetical protein